MSFSVVKDSTATITVNRHIILIKRALQIAAKVNHRWKVGAVVAKGRKIVGQGRNYPEKTHPLAENYSHCIHAEMSALLDLNSLSLAKGATIYVARWRLDGEPGNAEPCVYCRAWIEKVGLKEVYWTAGNGLVKYDRI